MIIGVGIDIIEISRIEEAIRRPAFINKVFTAAEQIYCEGRGRQRSASYAARFAGKEAVSKALGTGFSGGSWQDVEIILNEQGQPQVTLSGYFAGVAEQLGGAKIHISLTHARNYAAAQALLEGGNNEGSLGVRNAAD
jgi:holo-[acyl-carrier protein] synthase